jgi:hypothetical protein
VNGDSCARPTEKASRIVQVVHRREAASASLPPFWHDVHAERHCQVRLGGLSCIWNKPARQGCSR